MGIYIDRGIGYLIRMKNTINISHNDIYKILGKCGYLQGEYLEVIGVKELDDRLVGLSIYDSHWLDNCHTNKIIEIDYPKGLVLTDEEKKKINDIEKYLSLKGGWYDITSISMTY